MQRFKVDQTTKQKGCGDDNRYQHQELILDDKSSDETKMLKLVDRKSFGVFLFFRGCRSGNLKRLHPGN